MAEIICEHDNFKLCPKCSQLKPWMVFTPDGYRYGPGHKQVGETPYWQGAAEDRKARGE